MGRRPTPSQGIMGIWGQGLPLFHAMTEHTGPTVARRGADQGQPALLRYTGSKCQVWSGEFKGEGPGQFGADQEGKQNLVREACSYPRV